jgi:hypothetical protein
MGRNDPCLEEKEINNPLAGVPMCKTMKNDECHPIADGKGNLGWYV